MCGAVSGFCKHTRTPKFKELCPFVSVWLGKRVALCLQFPSKSLKTPPFSNGWKNKSQIAFSPLETIPRIAGILTDGYPLDSIHSDLSFQPPNDVMRCSRHFPVEIASGEWRARANNLETHKQKKREEWTNGKFQRVTAKLAISSPMMNSPLCLRQYFCCVPAPLLFIPLSIAPRERRRES